nr:retrovirus-related Pol polyprotein from transposon TNT 1-94 [Tanacetum cinerariifolium]
MDTMTSRHSIVSNTPLSSNSFEAHRDCPIHRLNHNLFSVGQFYDADLEVAFMKSTCFFRDLKGNDLLTASINGKRYVLVIVDDYSRYTWTHFLRSKDETPKVLIDFLRLFQRGLQAQVRVVRIDKGTEFLNQTLHAYFAAEGIKHQTFVDRTPEQNGVVERRNHHPLEQVIGNPSQSVRTRRQLESDAEMCMFALTVSRTESKNIKEAMADFAWIESMQEELHQFDRLEVW